MLDRSRSGFTVIELLWVIVIMGVMGALAIPRIRGALQKQNVRSARVAGVAHIVKARAAAVQRGCRATVHVRSSGLIWVTACKTAGPGIDTLGSVDDLHERYGVTLLTTRDSVQFDPRGLSLGNQTDTVVVRNAVATDSIVVNAVGRVVR
jgi:prepilin-type N-terminal cleavage/methylation domain-containing protein